MEKIKKWLRYYGMPQECKGESKEASICRRRWMEISKRINELV